MQVIKESRPRTKRWISSSIPESRWNTDLAKYSSAAYHVNNLVSPVLFQEALQVRISGVLVLDQVHKNRKNGSFRLPSFWFSIFPGF